jgi:hypothetical protein
LQFLEILLVNAVVVVFASFVGSKTIK